MNELRHIPESIRDAKKHIFKKAWVWIGTKPLWLKAAIILIIACAMIFSARLNFFGEPYFKYSQLFIPWHLPGVDPVQPLISLLFSYEIKDASGRKREGKLGDVCYSKDRIYLSVRTDRKCYICIFGIDSKGIHPVLKKNGPSPIFIDRDKNYEIDFRLDDTTGLEIYYAIASHTRFDFDESINPYLKFVFHQGTSKGPQFSEFHLQLPDEFVQRFIYFQHH
jgi:hypothetical protein